MKIGLVTLGCDKNTVDSERYLAQLSAYGGEVAGSLDEADVIIVNTCGFIDAAKKESIDAIVEAGQYKIDGVCKAVVAVGCMVERHKGELAEALPEVDLFLGASETDRLIEELHGRGIIGEEDLLAHPGVRVYAGDLPHVRYLKVSEGCDHGCAFCAIPLMRGKHRSFAPDDVVAEAQLLELQGAREINLVAQDLAHYGRDLRDRDVKLADLLERLVAETSIPWIRLLYLYSTGVTPRLLEVVAREPRILPYLDMPMQHAADSVLARMRRPERKHTIRDRVARFREAVPDVAIRTTCIVGFPGETDVGFRRARRVSRGGPIRARRCLRVFTAGRNARGAAAGRCTSLREDGKARAVDRPTTSDHSGALRVAHRGGRSCARRSRWRRWRLAGTPSVAGG